MDIEIHDQQRSQSPRPGRFGRYHQIVEEAVKPLPKSRWWDGSCRNLQAAAPVRRAWRLAAMVAPGPSAGYVQSAETRESRVQEWPFIQGAGEGGLCHSRIVKLRPICSRLAGGASASG